MIWMIRSSIVSKLLAAGIIGLLAPATQAAEAATTPLQTMLTDPELWGDNGIATIAAIGYWGRLGETTITIYSDKAVGGTSFSSQDDAQQSATHLSELMKRALPRLRAAGGVFAKALQAHVPTLRPEPIQLIEDDSVRVGWKGDDGTFLKKNVKMRAVIARYGKPEKITSELVNAKGDRRPAMLTVHEYANGTVKFIQTDQSFTPDAVDRVVINAGAAARELYVSAP